MHHLNIRNHRKLARISQKELAKRVGISTSYLNLIESGKRPLSDGLLNRIVSALGNEEFHDAAAHQSSQARTLDHIYDDTDAPIFVANAPKWANRLLDANHELNALRAQLSRTVSPLDHDEYLRDQFHDLLTHATSLLSISNVLNTHGNIPAETNAKFRDLNETEAKQLSQKLRALIHYIESNDTTNPTGNSPSPSAIYDRLRNDRAFREELSHLARSEFSREDIDQFTRLNAPELQNHWQSYALIERFAKDMAGLTVSQISNVAGASDIADVVAFANQRNISIDRALRIFALANAHNASRQISIGIFDRTGDCWLQPNNGRLAFETQLNCAYWPHHAPVAADGFGRVILNIDNGTDIYDVWYAQGLWSALGNRPMTMSTIVVLDAEPNMFGSMPVTLAGVNCHNCKKKDCEFRRGFDIAS